MIARPNASLKGLCLSRRPGERITISHRGHVFVMDLEEVGPEGVRLGLRSPGAFGFSAFLPKREGSPFWLDHDGERLAILVVGLAGSTARLLFSGPKSFGIRRDDSQDAPEGRRDPLLPGLPPGFPTDLAPPGLLPDDRF